MSRDTVGVFVYVSDRFSYTFVPRRLYTCDTEIFDKRSNRASPYTTYISESVFRSAPPVRRPSALSSSARSATSSAVYTRGNVGCVRSHFTTRPVSRFRRIKRSSCVSEYLVHCLMYALTIPFSFFERWKYPNF